MISDFHSLTKNHKTLLLRVQFNESSIGESGKCFPKSSQPRPSYNSEGRGRVGMTSLQGGCLDACVMHCTPGLTNSVSLECMVFPIGLKVLKDSVAM